MTTEAIAAKLSYLLALPGATAETVRAGLPLGLRGEITEQRQQVRLQYTSPDCIHHDSKVLPKNIDHIILSHPEVSQPNNTLDASHHHNLSSSYASTTSSIYDLSSHITEADVGTGTGDIVLRIGAFEEGE
jgi:hypothetical protein